MAVRVLTYVQESLFSVQGDEEVFVYSNESTSPVAVPLYEEGMKDIVVLLLGTYFAVA
jgi:hypothetical protein